MLEKQMIGVHPLGKVSEFRQNVNPMETKSRGKLLHEVLKERKALPECPISGEESREGGSGKRGRQEGCPRQERGRCMGACGQNKDRLGLQNATP